MKAPRAVTLASLATLAGGVLGTGGSAAWAAAPGSTPAYTAPTYTAAAYAAPPFVAAGSAATLLLQTVPAIQDVGVSLDGSVYRTGTSGSVAIPTISGWHHIRILPPASLPPGTSVRFTRWLDGISLASREIAVPPGTHVQQAGFVVSRPIAIRFTDEDGRPVPLSEVERLTITNGVGQRFTFSPARPPRMLGMDRVVRGTAGLLPLAISYAVRSVTIDGSNVVFDGSQRFSIRAHQRPWTIKVLLFPLRVQVRDALFKFGIGHAVRMTFPDGSRKTIRLGPGHSAQIPELPRGYYQLVSEGPGLGFGTPVALSSPQSATLLMLSWEDMLAVAAFAVLFLVGLPLLGGRIVRRPGRARLLAWQAGPEAATRHGMAEPRSTVAAAPEILHVTKVLPVIREMADPASPPRGKRRRPR